MNKQEYLDLLVTTSRDGGFPSREQICKYRMEDGRKCAVGLLIPDGDYSAGMESRRADELLDAYPLVRAFIPAGLSDDDLNLIQDCHDFNWRAGEDSSPTRAWDHDKFVADLLALDCFRGLAPVSEGSGEHPAGEVVPVIVEAHHDGCD